MIGNDAAITFAAEAGQFQLNAMGPPIAFDLHISLQLLERSVRALDECCVSGMGPDAVRCREHLDASVVTATALVPVIGYGRSARLAKDALRQRRLVAELAVEQELISSHHPVELHI